MEMQMPNCQDCSDKGAVEGKSGLIICHCPEGDKFVDVKYEDMVRKIYGDKE
jgi:hypothetical protein